MKMKKLVTLCLSVILLVSISTVAFADTFYSVNMPVIKQQQTEWCWAASGEMQGRVINPTSDRNQRMGVYYVTGGYLNQPNTAYAAAKVAAYVSYNKKSYSINGVWSLANIRYEIATKKSSLNTLAGYYDNYGRRTGGHFVVIDGAYQTANTIRYADSWDGTRKYCSYQSFVDGSYNGRKYESTIYAR